MVFKKQLIREILDTLPETRKSDTRLYAEYVKVVKPELVDVGFYELFANAEKYDLPSYEGLTRQKRKIVEKEFNVLENQKKAILKSMDKKEKEKESEKEEKIVEKKSFKIYSAD